MFRGFIKYEKLNSIIKLSNNSSFVILIFAFLKFRNIGCSTFRRFKISPPPIFAQRRKVCEGKWVWNFLTRKSTKFLCWIFKITVIWTFFNKIFKIVHKYTCVLNKYMFFSCWVFRTFFTWNFYPEVFGSLS